MRFRQVHLDFHTSEAIPDVGARFSPAQFQEMLRRGHVDSVTLFSKCHHGWSYHPTQANEMHPHLDFDLLGAQIAAAHEIGVRAPVYLSAGLDEKQARRRPDWLIRSAEDRTQWVDSFLKPGFHEFCMNTPYLDGLVAQTEEVVRSYDADGLFLDIVGVRPCVCTHCIQTLLDEGADPRDPAAVLALGERTYAEYARRIDGAVHALRPGLPVFHNGGHIRRGRRDLAHFNTHLELESLPTGGWGYDHFPLSARYAATLGMDYLGMTGKFHTFWGEFGGYKHPNALRYEAALSLAMGGRVSVGDQLHPSGAMDPATYTLIGAAYAEVAQKEAWCVRAANIADVALLSAEAAGGAGGPGLHGAGGADSGAVRMLLEGKVLFDVVDLEADFAHYKVILLPDTVRVGGALRDRLAAFCAGGGRVLATGEAGLDASGGAFALDLGARWEGPCPYRPSYYRPAAPLPALGEAAFVFYGPAQAVSLAAGGTALGYRQDPYFNREFDRFCSHQHTPNTGRDAAPGMTEGRDGIYLAWAAFGDYASRGGLALRETVLYALDRLLGERRTLEIDLPAQGVVTLTGQPDAGRLVAHLLYAPPALHGSVEVIEDLPTLRDVRVSLRPGRRVTRARLEPQGADLPFEQEDGRVRFVVPSVTCHQMVVLDGG